MLVFRFWVLFGGHCRSITLFGCLAFLLSLGACRKKQAPPATTVVAEETVYIWQRLWTGDVVDSVGNVAQGIDTLVPLVAEFHYPEGGAFKQISVNLDIEVLEAANQQLVAGIRIPFVRQWDDQSIAEISTAITELQNTYPAFKKVQIDYDCPESRLADYAKLLSALAAQLGKENLSFTALPSWLNDIQSFQNLAQHSDYFVLQVHWVDTAIANRPRLIDIAKTRDYFKAANKVGAPFQIALPTYGSFVVYDEAKRVIDIVSEDLPVSWPIDTSAKLAFANPEEIAGLVRELLDRRPSRMKGIAWYRLPIKSDLLNWPISTFQLVRQGVAPKTHWQVETKVQTDGSTTIILSNQGQQPELNFPEGIEVTSTHSISAFDTTQLFTAINDSGSSVRFQLRQSQHDLLPFPIGQSVVIGWVRTDGKLDSKVHQ